MVADDRLLCAGHADENVLIALGEQLVSFGALLLLCDDNSSSSSRLTRMPTIMRSCSSHAPIADVKRQVANRLAVDASKASGGADAKPLAKRGDDLDLLVTRENVHGGPNPSK
jgi:hypothetical protein